MTLSPAQQIALWADALRHMAASGLRFAPTLYDQERYHALQTLAMEMQAYAGGQAPEALEPLRAGVFSHVTPFCTADAAIIDAEGRLLLIRRADNGLWALPGGALEVGETPAQGAAREALEESGVASEPVALAGVWDSRLCGSMTRHHMYHFVVLCRPLPTQPKAPASHAHEVLGVGWFREAELPTDLDPGHVTRIPHAFKVWRGEASAHLDL
ncbi:NUDIX hydrolase N-terminal domain-containing protein [Caldilinea sp.]|jgi:ADP-ribose pyrophosphatase YjhB (NUDIX family)|uniref:NUDIX hydrolase N-terminal domain-containing protein n=1 Tax=Caldilinea sp. TaxID=2293560 RepID=UPI002609B20B|nr:NUDIX hydrolase N-terminal domain-containing protein [uncultured Caldilinea sp.]